MIKNFQLFEMINKEYVVDITDSNIPENVRRKVYDDNRKRGYGNNSYIYYYVCDAYKPIKDVKNLDNIVKQTKSGYCYEKGDDIISDWLLDQGLKPNEKVLFRVWW